MNISMKKTGKENRHLLRIKEWFGSYHVFVLFVIAQLILLGTLIYVTVMWATQSVSPFWNYDPNLGPDDPMIYTTGRWIYFLTQIIPFGAVMWLVPLLRKKLKLRIPFYIDLYVIIGLLGHASFGSVMRAFDHVPHYDKILHGVSGAIFTVIGISMMWGYLKKKGLDPKKSVIGLLVFGFMFSMSIAVLWEFLEFAVDSIGGTNMQRWRDGLYLVEVCEYVYNVGNVCTSHWATGPYGAPTHMLQGTGLVDTMLDMIFHFVGVLVVMIFFFIWWKKKPGHDRLLILKKTDCAKNSETIESTDEVIVEAQISDETHNENLEVKKENIDKSVKKPSNSLKKKSTARKTDSEKLN